MFINDNCPKWVKKARKKHIFCKKKFVDNINLFKQNLAL